MAVRPIKITITYCSECGYEPQTLALADALMRAFRHELAAIEIIPWYDGSFDVSVAGERVHSMYDDSGFPDPATIIAAVRRHQAAGMAGAPDPAAPRAEPTAS
ncbi:MAG TPA: Rdx family protein [Ktedonobacterales bacterium]